MGVALTVHGAHTVLEELLARPGFSVVSGGVRKTKSGVAHTYTPKAWEYPLHAPSFSHRLYLLIATKTTEARDELLREINERAFDIAKRLPADFLDADFDAFALKTPHVKVVVKSSEHALLRDLLSRSKKKK